MNSDSEDELLIASAIYIVLASKLKKKKNQKHDEDGGLQLYLKIENCMYILIVFILIS
jgi:hypothetical protein